MAPAAGLPYRPGRLPAPPPSNCSPRIISGGTPDQQKTAQAVLRALDGPRADIRLQIIILETELQATPDIADDDRLRIHHALAENYHQLGSYQPALLHGIEELRYRLRLQNPDHPDVLTTRNNIAQWTGECGDARGALRLFQELLPDQVRVLGPDHPGVLTTRSNIASWTGQCGDAAGRRCGCSGSCCPTGSGCWAPTTPTS